MKTKVNSSGKHETLRYCSFRIICINFILINIFFQQCRKLYLQKEGLKKQTPYVVKYAKKETNKNLGNLILFNFNT